jgi:hypothetical protein
MDSTRDRDRIQHPTTADHADVAARLDALLSRFDTHFDRHPIGITILLTEFFLPYLRELYRAFDGDIAMALVLGEIGQCTTRRFTDPGRRDALDIARADDAGIENLARPCSALSASFASGVPRETARRKVVQLAERGWILETEDGWVVTDKPAAAFVPTFNRDQARRLLETARRMIELLDRA